MDGARGIEKAPMRVDQWIQESTGNLEETRPEDKPVTFPIVVGDRVQEWSLAEFDKFLERDNYKLYLEDIKLWRRLLDLTVNSMDKWCDKLGEERAAHRHKSYLM